MKTLYSNGQYSVLYCSSNGTYDIQNTLTSEIVANRDWKQDAITLCDELSKNKILL